ncbi:thioredoxin fold domain-containing protein [Thermus albus]|uniref:thioredoxin fold domain-containing protein n=1 Tax=Thermus albus TaxID=2908146 RepID=UPI001FA96B57
MLENAWPRRERPYVLLFTDPLCPFCGRLEAALASDAEVKALVRYLPVAKHQGSYEAWLIRLRDWGFDEGEARKWLEEGLAEAERSGVRVTPTAVVMGKTEKVILGFSSYRTWREEVLDAIGP